MAQSGDAVSLQAMLPRSGGTQGEERNHGEKMLSMAAAGDG
jgi:hypothetical protein